MSLTTDSNTSMSTFAVNPIESHTDSHTIVSHNNDGTEFHIDIHTLFSLSVDMLLMFFGLYIAFYIKKLGGGIGRKSLKIITAGFVLLALVHIIETVIFMFLANITQLGILELFHRIIIAIALCFIIFGYRKLSKFLNS